MDRYGGTVPFMTGYFRIKMWTVYSIQLDPFHTLLHILFVVQFIIHYYEHRQHGHLSAMASLGISCQIAFGFRFFGFCNRNFLYREWSVALRPATNLEVQAPVFMSLVSIAQIYSPVTKFPFRRCNSEMYREFQACSQCS